MSVSSWRSHDDEEDTTDDIIAATRRGIYSARDNNSSSRYSTGSVTSHRSNYVWDTLDSDTDNAPPSYRSSSHSATMSPSSMSRLTDIDGATNNLAELSVSTPHTNTIDNSDIATYFSVPTQVSNRREAGGSPRRGAPDSAAKSIRSIDSNDSSDVSSLQSVVEEVKGKVDTMKAELSAKIKKIKELQADFARTQAAKERRIEKFKNSWQSRIRDVSEEHASVSQKQLEFLQRLETDVRKMQEKRTLLEQKQGKAAAGKEQSSDLYGDECRRKRVRAQRQWQQEEKVIFIAHASATTPFPALRLHDSQHIAYL